MDKYAFIERFGPRLMPERLTYVNENWHSCFYLLRRYCGAVVKAL